MRSDAPAGDGDAREALASAPRGAIPSGSSANFGRSVARLLSIPLLLGFLLAGFIVVIDPYWVFGSPSVPGINESRPFYETSVVRAKPYQVLRLRPQAVALGASGAEVGLSPDHPGWADRHAFNFAIPAANSYEVMLAFLHAQSAAAPLRQAVVGLDFIAFNVYRKLGPAFGDARFAWNDLAAFADFLDVTLAERRARRPFPPPSPAAPPSPSVAEEGAGPDIRPKPGTVVANRQLASRQAAAGHDDPLAADWDEKLYLALYPDVAAAVARGEFSTGYEHYVKNGRMEGRLFASVPSGWDEKLYLALYPDVAAVVAAGQFGSGYEHYLKNGRTEGRLFASVPSGWDEKLYLALHPDVAAVVASGQFGSGYEHYLKNGRSEGRQFAQVPPEWDERLYLSLYPDVAAAVAAGLFKSGYEHFLKNGRAEGRHHGGIPTDWNEKLYLGLYPDVAAAISRGEFPSAYVHYVQAGQAEGRLFARVPPQWDEKLYLALYPDVAAVIANGEFGSGYEHYLKNGQTERRMFAEIPVNWDEAGYLEGNPDVAQAVHNKDFGSGYHHYLIVGRYEGRLGGFPLPGWDEAGYLTANPAVRIAIARGQYRNGLIHYAAIGRAEGRVGGLPPANALEWLEARWPPLHSWLFKAKELQGLAFSAAALKDAVKTLGQQSVPASFSDRGQRIWRGQEEAHRKMGGVGKGARRWITTSAAWRIFWFDPPEQMFCLSHPDTLMSGLDPFRFMVRRAHAQGTDLRLFVSPIHAGVQRIMDALGLRDRYEFWLRELVRINDEEAARADREPFPLFDFSDTNSITSDPIPEAGDLKPMHWFWEIAHYREITGDLILDRLFGVHDPSRILPEDFGVRLTAASLDEHLKRSRDRRARWAAVNSGLAAQIDKAALPPRLDHQSEATCW